MGYYIGLNPLRDVLADLYPRESAARTVIAAAGISEQYIEFAGSAVEFWKSILTKAQNSNQIQDLIAVVLTEYPGNFALAEAEQTYKETTPSSAIAEPQPGWLGRMDSTDDRDSISLAVGGDNRGTMAGRDVRSSTVNSGISIDGGSSVQVGGHMVAGNYTAYGEGVNVEALTTLFAPLLTSIQDAPEGKSAEANRAAAALQAEIAKNESADDKVMGNLIQDLAELVPGTVGAIGAIFGEPLLAGLAGPATKFVLDRIGAISST